MGVEFLEVAHVDRVPRRAGFFATLCRAADKSVEKNVQRRSWRLSQLGWTQAEIGKTLEVSQQQASVDLLEIRALKKLVLSQLAIDLPVLELAQRHGLSASCSGLTSGRVNFFSSRSSRRAKNFIVSQYLSGINRRL